HTHTHTHIHPHTREMMDTLHHIKRIPHLFSLEIPLLSLNTHASTVCVSLSLSLFLYFSLLFFTLSSQQSLLVLHSSVLLWFLSHQTRYPPCLLSRLNQ